MFADTIVRANSAPGASAGRPTASVHRAHLVADRRFGDLQSPTIAAWPGLAELQADRPSPATTTPASATVILTGFMPFLRRVAHEHSVDQRSGPSPAHRRRSGPSAGDQQLGSAGFRRWHPIEADRARARVGQFHRVEPTAHHGDDLIQSYALRQKGGTARASMVCASAAAGRNRSAHSPRDRRSRRRWWLRPGGGTPPAGAAAPGTQVSDRWRRRGGRCGSRCRCRPPASRL